MILSNGQIFYTDSEIKDCDGDNLADGEEIFINYSETQFVIKKDKIGGNIEYSTVVFGYNSNPNDIDSDGDGLNDSDDPMKSIYNEYDIYNKERAVDYALKWYDGHNPGYYYYDKGDCANFVSQCLYAGGMDICDEWHYDYTLKEWDELNFYSLLVGYYLNKEEWIRWDISKTWRLATQQYEYISKSDYCEEVIKINSVKELEEAVQNKDIEKGDLLYVADDTLFHTLRNRDPYHATIISEVDLNNKNLLYAAHTDSYKDRSVKDVLINGKDDNRRVYVIKMKEVIILD